MYYLVCMLCMYVLILSSTTSRYSYYYLLLSRVCIATLVEY